MKLTYHQKLILICCSVWFVAIIGRWLLYGNEWAKTDREVFHKPVSHELISDTEYYDNNPYIPCSPDNICMSGTSGFAFIDSCGRVLQSTVYIDFYPFYNNGDIHRNLDKYGKLLR